MFPPNQGSLLVWKRTYGQTLAGIRPAKGTSLRRLLLRPILTAIAVYISKRGLQFMLGHRFHRAGEHTWKRRLLRLLTNAQRVVEVLSTLNHFVFLYSADFPTLPDRLLRLSYTRTAASATTMLGYLQQEMLIQVLLVALRRVAHIPASLPAWLTARPVDPHASEVSPSSSSSSSSLRCMRCLGRCIQLPCSGACGHPICFSCAVIAFTSEGDITCKLCGAPCRARNLRLAQPLQYVAPAPSSLALS
ncbi:hypothetical protein PTSG_03982 [Salpingoeca rosetta]|uniref:Pex N-terminal domain-containing protein n=1 Tax=Salpingoeca rosetta (strain ATCC 50818 / BSB-021) TaxID=946362 RepID=F2U7F8_SALR5|nr:uncharacterized protein PTSG_03982 [Salpingoeca rosetta]EGD83375.1 hypothetical protein PTSG_03982 [Salpingoeca rosetta]|eukprot:XP_004994879.1 hypothetical protein PTSG_03982 [Salpingoeca rosetta]